MNITYTHNIINLKQLSRHGQGLTNPKKQEQADQLDKIKAKNIEAAANKAVKDSYKDIVPGLNELINLELKLENLNKSRSITLNDLIATQTRFANNVVNLSKKFLTLELRNKELNKAFGINFKQAGVLGKSYDEFAAKLGISGQSTRKYAQDLNKLLPGMQKVALQGADTGDGLLKIQTAFQQQLGLSGEVANNFIRLSGGSEEALTSQLQLAKSLEKSTGLQGLTRDLVADMANLAPQIQLQFSRIPGSLELAVLKARTLGVSFSDISATGEKLLDIESSVNNELEYQLLSGKRLVDQNGKSLTQQFRQAAITGNANAQADAMNKILETQGDTIENNVFARKKLAETLGIEESKLAGMVQQRRLLKKLGPEAEGILKLQGDDLAKAVDKFKTENASLSGDLDALLKAADTRTTDDILIETLESLNASLAAGALAGLDDEGVGKALESIRGGFLAEDADGIIRSTSAVTSMVQSGNDLIKSLSPIMSVFQNTITEFKGSIDILSESMPIIGKLAKSLTDIGISLTSGGTFSGNFPPVSAPASPLTTVPATTTEDGIIRVNDAVLFNPNDKFNIVASTSPGALAQATSDITGGSSTGPSAQEIGSAVAKALQGVNLYVSPNELAAEMAFNSYNINT